MTDDLDALIERHAEFVEEWHERLGESGFCEDLFAWSKQAAAALTRLRQAPPREPTAAMIKAAQAVHIELITHNRPFDYVDCWRAMYRAAPVDKSENLRRRDAERYRFLQGQGCKVPWPAHDPAKEECDFGTARHGFSHRRCYRQGEGMSALPPSIQAMIGAATVDSELMLTVMEGRRLYPLFQRIAAEACRLQRDSDAEQADKFGITYAEDMPLVVPAVVVA